MNPARLFNQTVEVEPYDGEGAYGPIYGTPYTLPCRIEQERIVAVDDNGEERVVEARLFTAPDANIPAGSRVTLDGVDRRVMSARTAYGLERPSHLEVNLR